MGEDGAIFDSNLVLTLFIVVQSREWSNITVFNFTIIILRQLRLEFNRIDALRRLSPRPRHSLDIPTISYPHITLSYILELLLHLTALSLT